MGRTQGDTYISLFNKRDNVNLDKTFDRKSLFVHVLTYTEGRLDRYHICIPRELSEIRTQPWLSEGSLTCDPYHQGAHLFIAHRRNSITSVLTSIS